MRNLLRFTFFILFISLPMLSLAEGPAYDTKTITITKDDLKRIHIFSTNVDHIHLYLTDHNQQKYRLMAVSEEEAKRFLDHLKTGKNITIQTSIVEQRNYLNINSWK